MPSVVNTENVTLGGGYFEIAEHPSGSYETIGNAREATVELTQETVEYLAHTEGIEEKHDEVTIRQDYKVNLTLDEFSAKNLAKYIRGKIVDNEIRAFKGADDYWMLKYHEYRIGTQKRIWYFFKGKIIGSGPLSLGGGREWKSIPVQFVGLKDTDNQPNSPQFSIYTITTTTTSTT